MTLPVGQSMCLSEPAMLALRRLVSANIAYGRSSWSREQFREIVAPDIATELHDAGLLHSQIYQHTVLDASAVALALGWSL